MVTKQKYVWKWLVKHACLKLLSTTTFIHIVRGKYEKEKNFKNFNKSLKNFSLYLWVI